MSSSATRSRFKMVLGVAAVLFIAIIAIRAPGTQADSARSGWHPLPQFFGATTPAANEPLSPAALQWQHTHVEDLKFAPSSYKCTDAEDVYQTCMFTDMVMYRGDLLYIVEDSKAAKAVQLPSPLIFEVGNSPSNTFHLPDIIKVLPESDARSLLSTGIASTKSPFVNLAAFDVALFQRTRTFNNWFWAVNGAGNIFHRLCKYFDVCSSAEVRKAAVLQPIIDSSRDLNEVGYVGLPNHHAQAAKDLMNCFGPLFWVNHPAGRETEGRSVDEVLIFKKMLVGIGDDVVQPKAALDKDGEVRFEQAKPDISLKRVQFVRQCGGLPPDPLPRTRPSVLLVNRPYADGRTILSLDDVADRVRRSLPTDVTVRLFFPRGDAGIQDQAEAFNAATVVVAPHGAATANFNFLPHDAVALGVFALGGRWGHDEAVGASMPAPPYNITVWKVDCQETTEVRANAAAEIPAFQGLKARDQVALLLGKAMNARERTKQVKGLIGMSLLDWMDYRSYAPDPAVLTQQILDAVAEWEVKVEARRSRGSFGR